MILYRNLNVKCRFSIEFAKDNAIFVKNTVAYKKNAKSKILTLKAYNSLIIGAKTMILYLF